ncbi:hypothetical protein [Microbacterium sp.]|uniref:DNA polymerase III subunit beta family protein n=1 Tax=Microbacterium sp. TaxID=51671 RepID=UPI003A94E995
MLERALKFVLAAASKDDVTPVLTGVKWTTEGSVLTLTASDRYRVCVAKIDVGDDADLDVLMTGTQAKWILAQKHMPMRDNPDQFVEVSAPTLVPSSEGDRKPVPVVTARVVAATFEGADEFSMTAVSIAGNFPPVDRLFVEHGKAERADVVGLSPALLDFLKMMPGNRGEPIKMYAPELGAHGKAGPVQFESLDGSLRALLQPNLLRH